MSDNGNALAVREYPKLAELTGFTTAQINLVRQTVAPGLNIVELAWFLYNAKRLELEPLLGQIYAIRYDKNGPPDIVTGIHGYRSRAASSGEYAGSDDPIFEYEDVGQPKGAPSKATVTVWRMVQGQRCPFTASARWEEFYPGEKAGAQYLKRPHNQLAVRAESHALRKAFPYQMRDIDPHPAPAVWVEAAKADEQIQNAPTRRAALTARYDEIASGFYEEHQSAAAASPPPAAIVGASVDSPAAGAAPEAPVEMVTSKTDPRWKAWLDAERQARIAKVAYDADIHLPISAESLANSTRTLLEMIEDATSPAQEEVF